MVSHDQQGRTWLTAQDEYELDGDTPVNVVKKAVREFRYDATGRQRYLMRDRNTDGELLGDASTHTVWSDYDGEIVYDDLTVDVAAATAYPYPLTGVDVTERASYEPGVLHCGTGVPPVMMVPLTDHLGTTRVLTNYSGDVIARAAFTAFGEPVDEYGTIGGPGGVWSEGPGLEPCLSRYGYVGAHGYEGGSVWGRLSDNGLPSGAVTYLHVGERLYDPSSGRWLQRDPIGIRGGMNVYEYVRSGPCQRLDPTGQYYGWHMRRFMAFYLACGQPSEIGFVLTVFDDAMQLSTGNTRPPPAHNPDDDWEERPESDVDRDYELAVQIWEEVGGRKPVRDNYKYQRKTK